MMYIKGIQINTPYRASTYIVGCNGVKSITAEGRYRNVSIVFDDGRTRDYVGFNFVSKGTIADNEFHTNNH